MLRKIGIKRRRTALRRPNNKEVRLVNYSHIYLRQAPEGLGLVEQNNRSWYYNFPELAPEYFHREGACIAVRLGYEQ
jgi:hypothetical protein